MKMYLHYVWENKLKNIFLFEKCSFNIYAQKTNNFGVHFFFNNKDTQTVFKTKFLICKMLIAT